MVVLTLLMQGFSSLILDFPGFTEIKMETILLTRMERKVQEQQSTGVYIHTRESNKLEEMT